MRVMHRAVLVLFLLAAAGRAGGYLIYVWHRLDVPLESHHLEGAQLHTVWRAQSGRPLYDAWWNYPHQPNFFGPIYYWVAGGLARSGSATPTTLPRYARSVTLAATLASSLMLGVWTAWRLGRGAGLVALVASLGVWPMFGFTVMARPDALAEGWGFLGYVVCQTPGYGAGVIAVAALTAAVLTKQTAGVFLIAAALTLCQQRRFWNAASVLVGSGAAIGLSGALIAWNREPWFWQGFFGEAATPWSLENGRVILGRLVRLAPDLVVAVAVGTVACMVRVRRWWPRAPAGPVATTPSALGGYFAAAACLAMVLGLSSLVAVAKEGADVNYFLSLRLPAAALLACLARWAPVSPSRGWGKLAVAAVVIPLVGWGALISLSQGWAALHRAAWWRTPEGRAVAEDHLRLAALARSPAKHVLSDSGWINFHLGPRASLTDPWLFRLLVETGRIAPGELKARLERREFDTLILTARLEEPSYDAYGFGLPRPLLPAARAHYQFAELRSGLFVYVRRQAP